MDDRISMLQEANRRGLLPPEVKAAFDEASKRGLLEGRGFASGLARSLEQGATLGFGDEINAAARAGYGSITEGKSFSEGYDEALTDERAANAEFAANHPVIDTVAQIAGGAVPGLVAPGLAGVSYVQRANSALQAGRRAAAVGAGYGAVSGFGAGSGGISNRAASAAVGAPAGAVLGGGLGYAGYRLGEAIGGARQAAQEVDPQGGAYNVVAKALRRDNIEPAQLQEDMLPPAGRTVTQDTIRRIAELSDQGMTNDQIANNLGIASSTVGNHLRAFANRNTTPMTIVDRASLRGPGSGQNTQWTMRAAAATPGEARTRAAETLTERQLGQSNRVVDAVQRYLGDGDIEGRIAELQAKLRMQERDAYQAAAQNERPFDLTGVLNNWRQRVNPGVQRGGVRGRVAEDNSPIASAMNRVIDAFYDDVDVPNALNTGFLRAQYPIRGLARFQSAKDELDYAIEQSFKDHRPTALTRQLQQFKADIMGEVRRTNPEWARANDMFADGRAGQRALQLGEETALRLGQGSRDTLRQYAAMDETQQELFRQGLSRRIQDIVLNKTDGADVTAQFRTPAAQRMLRRIMERRGDRASTRASRRDADALIRILNEEAAGTRTFRSVQGGSQTTPLREAIDDLNAPAYLTSAASYLNPHALAQEIVSQVARRVYETRNNALLGMLTDTDPVRQLQILDAISRYSAARGKGGTNAMRAAPLLPSATGVPVRAMLEQKPTSLQGRTPMRPFNASDYDAAGNRIR